MGEPAYIIDAAANPCAGGRPSQARPAPTINVDYFPNTVNSYYWTASANAYDQRLAWFIYFGSGYEYYDLKTAPFAVRLVRGHH